MVRLLKLFLTFEGQKTILCMTHVPHVLLQITNFTNCVLWNFEILPYRLWEKCRMFIARTGAELGKMLLLDTNKEDEQRVQLYYWIWLSDTERSRSLRFWRLISGKGAEHAELGHILLPRKWYEQSQNPSLDLRLIKIKLVFQTLISHKGVVLAILRPCPATPSQLIWSTLERSRSRCLIFQICISQKRKSSSRSSIFQIFIFQRVVDLGNMLLVIDHH